MFKKFFIRDDEEDEVYEKVDPVLEQRRKEKFSTPLIYNDEEDVQEEKKVETKKTPVKKPQQTEMNYQMSKIISPISGVQKKYEPEIKPKQHKKVKIKTNTDELIPIISPFYGPSEAIEETNDPIQDKANEIEEEPSVEKNLRNIANIVKEEQDQLKIIEQRTGEFKLDFHDDNEDSLIDEIDDSMSLDELMSLYEKKFKD